MRTIAVFGIKGGVGKTTTAVNLAHASAVQSGRRTLLWDLDGQGAASYLLGLDSSKGQMRRIFADSSELRGQIRPTAYDNLDLLPADTSLRNLEKQLAENDKPKQLKKMLKSLEADYDRVILDCPPGLGGLSEQIFRAVDAIVVPMLPSPLSLRTFAQLQDHLTAHHEGKPTLLPVYTMVDRRKKLHADVVAKNPDIIVIPYSSVIERMAVDRAPIATMGGAASAAAYAFGELWSQIERQLVGAAAGNDR